MGIIVREDNYQTSYLAR